MRSIARGFLGVVSVLDGASGLVCGALLMARPDGRLLMASALLPVIRKLPLAQVFFQDLFWIGLAMVLALGIPNSLAALLLLRRSPWQYAGTAVAAVLLMLWCGFELVFMFNFAAVGYFTAGAVSLGASAFLLVRHAGEQRDDPDALTETPQRGHYPLTSGWHRG